MLEMNSWRKLIVCVFLEMQARDAKSILEQRKALVDFRDLEYAAGIVGIVIPFEVSFST